MFECSLLKVSIKLYKKLYGFYLPVTIFQELQIIVVTFKS